MPFGLVTEQEGRRKKKERTEAYCSRCRRFWRRRRRHIKGRLADCRLTVACHSHWPSHHKNTGTSTKTFTIIVVNIDNCASAIFGVLTSSDQWSTVVHWLTVLVHSSPPMSLFSCQCISCEFPTPEKRRKLRISSYMSMQIKMSSLSTFFFFLKYIPYWTTKPASKKECSKVSLCLSVSFSCKSGELFNICSHFLVLGNRLHLNPLGCLCHSHTIFAQCSTFFAGIIDPCANTSTQFVSVLALPFSTCY